MAAAPVSPILLSARPRLCKSRGWGHGEGGDMVMVGTW